MRERTYSLIIFLLTLYGTGNCIHAQENEYWTLEQCIEYAWENNLRLQQQKLTVDIAQEDLLQTRANAYPSLNLHATHVYNVGRTIDPFTNEFASRTVQSNNFSATTGVNLFNGFQLRNLIRQNEYDLEARKHDLARSYNDIALNVAAAYLQILFNIEQLENVSNQLEITTQQVERTKRLVEAGTLARGSSLTIQAQLATEELQVINAQNQLDISLLTLQQMLFLPIGEELRIAVPEVDIYPEDEPLDTPLSIYSLAVQTQPEVVASEIRILSAERGVAVAKGTRSPSLSLRGSFGSGYSGASRQIVGDPIVTIDPVTGFPVTDYETRIKPFTDQLKDNLNQSVGLFLTIPVFNHYQSRANISRSRIYLEDARLQNLIVRDQLYKTIQQAHADAQAALRRFHASNVSVIALEEAFRYTEQRFNVGMVNTLEYNDAKNRLTFANSELLQAKYEFIFRTKILDFYMGHPIRL
jgi:outer membrane protein